MFSHFSVRLRWLDALKVKSLMLRCYIVKLLVASEHSYVVSVSAPSYRSICGTNECRRPLRRLVMFDKLKFRVFISVTVSLSKAKATVLTWSVTAPLTNAFILSLMSTVYNVAAVSADTAIECEYLPPITRVKKIRELSKRLFVQKLSFECPIERSH